MPEPWRKSKAKEQLRQDIVSKRVTKETTPERVYTMRRKYAQYEFKRFKLNLKRLLKAADNINVATADENTKKTTRRKKKEEPVPWKHSRAKEILKKEIINETVKPDMTPEFVYSMHSIFSQYSFSCFKDNLKNLHEAVKRDIGQMERDALDYGHDLAIIRQRRITSGVTRIPWHGSAARRLLVQDVREGKHKTMKPIEFYHSREEYKEYTLQKVRNHIYQEIDGEKKKAWRIEKKKTKLKEIRAKWKEWAGRRTPTCPARRHGL